MLPIEISELAALELTDAYDWYENQRSGLGDDLLREFELACKRIAEFPEAYQVVLSEMGSQIRRAPVRRFPYGVFFEVTSRRVVVTSFFHGKRAPRHRLK